MDAAKNVTAAFSLKTYTITLPSVSNGSISCNPTTVNHGSGTICTATPTTGYHLATLTDNGVNAFPAIVDGSYTVNNIVANHTITPAFAINTYTIATSAGANGSMTASSTVNFASEAVIAITPDTNYHVEDVLVDGVSAGAVTHYTFTKVGASHKISATFAINRFALSITKSGTGSGTVVSSPAVITCGNSCSALYATGTSVTLSASPAFGSTFTGWSGGVCSGTGSCSLTVDKNMQITASFANPWGDINDDGKIDLADAVLSLQVLSGVSTAAKTITMAADANINGNIDVAETIYILQKIAGFR
jgi:hypothetical protein